VLQELVTAAVAVVPGADEGSIAALSGRGRIEHIAATGNLPRTADSLMAELEEGPCLDVRTQRTIRVDDFGTDGRWPGFGPRAVGVGVHSMLSFQLSVEGDNLGVLNLYGREPSAFTDESEQAGLLFAAHAAIAYAGARRPDELLDASEARDLVDRAVGIMMERYRLGSDRAFTVLARISQVTHRGLREIAAEIVDEAPHRP